MNTNAHSNKLGNETSPYLLQHANNPVHWWPWCEQALQTARAENKPILLSIGYSACHWCHVMAHESFEDEDTARLMNELYINIKVDREERPDLDRIYQSAHQLLNQRAGGWPLTMILTPQDQVPFFAGTYFPVTAKYNMPAFREILQRVHDFYRQHIDEINTQNDSLLTALANIEQPVTTNTTINPAPLDQARRQLEQHFDSKHAGFGRAPKFPHPTSLERLLRHWSATREQGNEDSNALAMLNQTLQAMANGGLYDQLGGGFCRYSVDEVWMIPHFEKMLYDNGPLLALYACAFAATGNELYQRIANETAQWVMREMQSDDGGYYSTLDADTEGEEGRFYIWTPGQVSTLLTGDEYAVFSRVFGLNLPANFEGHWHLHTFRLLPEVAAQLGMTDEHAQQLLQSARQKLFAAREGRIHPGRDEKILTSWNGLMIKGMAVAARHLDNMEYVHSAQQAVDFIRLRLFENGRLLASYKDGRAHLMAYLDDYAFLLEGLLELLQSDWRNTDLDFAITLADTLLEYFEDQQAGGFYFTAHDHEPLIQRPKPGMDEAVPAGNAIAALALARLGHLLGEHKYLAASERTLRFAWPAISQAPWAHAAFLHALEEYLYPPQLFVLRGDADKTRTWQQHLLKHYLSRRMVFSVAASETTLPGLLAQHRAKENTVVAYYCSAGQCHAPLTSLEELLTIVAQNNIS